MIYYVLIIDLKVIDFQCVIINGPLVEGMDM